MKLIHENGQFIAESTFEERFIPKAAGLEWKGKKRHWWTADADKAAKLVEYADDTVKAMIAAHQEKKQASRELSRAAAEYAAREAERKVDRDANWEAKADKDTEEKPKAKPRRKARDVFTDEQIDALNAALAVMVGLCDGAFERDKVGFNKCDAYIGRQLAYGGILTANQADLAKTILRKYHRQIGDGLMTAIYGEGWNQKK